VQSNLNLTLDFMLDAASQTCSIQHPSAPSRQPSLTSSAHCVVQVHTATECLSQWMHVCVQANIHVCVPANIPPRRIHTCIYRCNCTSHIYYMGGGAYVGIANLTGVGLNQSVRERFEWTNIHRYIYICIYIHVNSEGGLVFSLDK